MSPAEADRSRSSRSRDAAAVEAVAEPRSRPSRRSSPSPRRSPSPRSRPSPRSPPSPSRSTEPRARAGRRARGRGRARGRRRARSPGRARSRAERHRRAADLARRRRRSPRSRPAHDVIAQPTWQMVAPDRPPVAPRPPTAGTGGRSRPSDRRTAVADPARMARAAPDRRSPVPRPPAVADQGGLEALWAESDRDVAAPARGRGRQRGVQPCVSCGLSLSATARFCRRCGTAQTR